MAYYRVSHASGHDVALQDKAGRHHVARALHGAPQVGAEFHGPRPERGLAILADASSKALCRVIFEEVNCSHQDMLARLRPQPVAGA